MPHVHIKHFPEPLSEERRQQLVSDLTEAVVSALGCPEDVVSIAMEPVEPEDWTERVYVPDIVNCQHLLCKEPKY